VGQVLLVLADEETIQGPGDVAAGMTVGVRAHSQGEQMAQAALGLDAADIYHYETFNQAVEALADESVDALVMDHYSAAQYAATYPEQLKIAGEEAEAAWIGRDAYGIALAAQNEELRARLNEAIAEVQASPAQQETAVTWLVPDVSAVDVGESRVGTPGSELIIGMVGELPDLDPAGAPDLISWEVKSNVMGGLYRLTPQNEIEPLLAAGPPQVSEEGTVYTIRLRQDLRYPDGSEFTAADVKWSLDRAAVAGAGSYLINGYLKDENEDNFADADAVDVVDQFTVRITLREPLAYFTHILATPPYFPISNECYAEVFDPASVCGGIGPYTIVAWEQGERLRLRANPDWPGPAPAFENVQVRFYGDAAAMRRSLAEFQSIDVAWTGLPYADFVSLQETDVDGDAQPDVVGQEGPDTFKSYLIFEQSTPPWDNERVRQAAAYAIDREALAQEVFSGSRAPLYSPVPETTPGHAATLPARDLAQARALLLEAGYSEEEPLPITIWYLNDGRYTPLEEAYANAIKAQLEETGVFQVTLSGAPWEIFQTQIFSCGYPAYLLGWPSPGAPVDYLGVTSWTNFFVQNTDRVFCSNYESEEMTELVDEAAQELDDAARQEIYVQMQELWAEELPTLDLLQEPRRLLALNNVDGVAIDAMGFLHYEALTKDDS
jgi:peptide/nickel transport system substrate-binding protein